MHKIDAMLLRMIKNSKSQFFAILIIIVIGICVFTSLNMAAMNLEKTVELYYKNNRFPDLFLQTSQISGQMVKELDSINGVEKAMGRISMDAPMITETMNQRVNLRLITVNNQEDALSTSTFIQGRLLSDSGREILLIQQFAKARNISIGETIKVQMNGLQVNLEVVGIVENPEFIYLVENQQSIMPAEGNFGVGYISESVGQQATGFFGSYNEIVVQYKEKANEEALINDIKKELGQYGVHQLIKRENQFSNAFITEEINSLKQMARSLPLLFLLVAGLILMMMISRMVKKDRIKIGVLKAMGYSRIQVLSHYVKYALIAGALGGLIGSVLGMALAGGMTRLYLEFFHIPLLKVEFYYSYIALAMLLSCIFCIISGLIGARGVLKISPSDAMRNEPPKIGKRILLEKLPFLWRRLSFSHKMVAKNILRNKKRTIFVMAGVMLTYGMMLFTASMPDVIDQMMVKHYVEFQKMDYNISFKTPVTKKAVQDLSHLIEVDSIEGKIEYPFELANGNKRQGVNIIGLSKDTSFYSFKNLNGSEIKVPNNGILLSENLASNLKVREGDTLLVTSPIPGKENVYLTVNGIVKQTLGMNAYMEINNMGEQLFEKNVINGVFVNSSDEKINEKLLGALNVASIMSIQDVRSVYDEYMQLTMLSIGFMVIFSGILGFAIVYNATMVSISEREMELSSLRVLGFSKWRIFMMILKENNIIMIIGIILGIPVGKIFAEYSSEALRTDMYSIDMSPTFSAGVMAAIATVVFILFAQMATYRKIKGLDFLQALKNRES